MANKNTSLRNYLSLSLIAAVFVGVLVYAGTRKFVETLIWAGVTFIVSLVSIATLALTVKDQDDDPTKPRLD